LKLALKLNIKCKQDKCFKIAAGILHYFNTQPWRIVFKKKAVGLKRQPGFVFF